jgi:radical SAM superfamily enzyme YgiQ (UPF0313 family)
LIHFAFIENTRRNSGNRSYTSYVLEALYPEITRVSIEKADVLLVSVNDTTQLRWLKTIRQTYRDKLIVVGGFESYCGETLLAYSDMVNVGEGFEFFDALRNEADLSTVKSFFEFIQEKPYVLTRNKINEVVTPSYKIDWKEVPLAQTGKTGYYYLLSKGCPNKCQFCMTSWTQPFQRNTSDNIARILKFFEENKHCKLTFVSNEGYQFQGFHSNIASKSVMVKQFLENPLKYRKTSMLHIGVEGFSEKVRAQLGKPISNRDLFDLFFMSKKIGIEIEIFMILGLPNDNRIEFLENIPRDLDLKPRIHMQFHWLEHSPHTPFWRKDITRPIEPFYRDQWFFTVSAYNRRLRTRPVKWPAHADWRSLILRVPLDKVNSVLPLESEKSREKLFTTVRELDLEEYLAPGPNTRLANECIKTLTH